MVVLVVVIQAYSLPLPLTKARTRKGDVAALLSLLVLCLLLSLLRGRRRDESLLQVQCGSVHYWGLLLLQVLLAAFFALGVRSVLICRHERKVASGFPFDAHDVTWSRRSTLVHPLTCAAAGTLTLTLTLTPTLALALALALARCGCGAVRGDARGGRGCDQGAPAAGDGHAPAG